MPCCNFVQIPEESLQGCYRFLGVELEVNVVDVFVQSATKQYKKSLNHTCICTNVFLKPLCNCPGYRGLPDSFSPGDENCRYFGASLVVQKVSDEQITYFRAPSYSENEEQN